MFAVTGKLLNSSPRINTMATERRVNIRVSDSYVLDQIAQNGVQSTLEPLIEGGAVLKESGVLEQLIFLKSQGLVDDLGSLEALRMAIDFAEKIQNARGKNPPAVKRESVTVEPAAPAKKMAVTEARKNAF